MMAFSEPYTLLVLLMWITFSSSNHDAHQSAARIRISYQNGIFPTFWVPKTHVGDMMKLIKDPIGTNIYAGGPQGLCVLKPEKQSAQLKLVPFEAECIDSSSTCKYAISLLKEGRNGHPLFICGTHKAETICCDMNLDLTPMNCSSMMYTMQINEPSLHVGQELYFTLSSNMKGLYRCFSNKCIWPQVRLKEKYVKIIANEDKKTSNGKVYLFYIEENTNSDLDTSLWIPRVSQVCMIDRGGSKEKLQNSWTSMLAARLFCGDKRRRLSYTELLDISVLEDKDWNNASIYALFKNAYNLSAVCVYSMADIIHAFKNYSFKGNNDMTFSPRPGECVQESDKLPLKILNFMEKRPEMEGWIMPARKALLFNNNCYTHLQVDRVNGHDILFMSLENGRIHKVLEQDGFIITEYQPFPHKVQVHSMLLDRSTKKLFVSSSNEVAQITLNNCSMYETNCASCVMAKDPYCGWALNHCSHKYSIQNVITGDPSVCRNDSPEPEKSSARRSLVIPQDSKYYLKCPMTSQHASYTWYHHDSSINCTLKEQDCFLLIDSMNEKDEGIYECKAKENGYEWTIKQQELRMNGASRSKAASAVLTYLLLLVFVIW